MRICRPLSTRFDTHRSQQSARSSTRPRRYADGDYDFQEPGVAAIENGQDGSSGVEFEDEETLLRSTSHIWRAPLQDYIFARHAARRRLEQDVEAEAASRKFQTAARVHTMSQARLVAMQARRQTRSVEVMHESEMRRREEEAQALRAEQEDQLRLSKDNDREERLRKQREAARKKREDERAKKERDEESRRARTEEARLARIAEAERRAALTPEQRAAEDQVLMEKLAREKEEAAAKLREFETSTEGRGARKRKRLDDGSREGSLSAYYDDYDDFDDLSKSRSKGKVRASSQTQDERGRGMSPYPLPAGAYLGSDGTWLDSQGQSIATPRGYASSHDYASDDAELLVAFDENDLDDTPGAKLPHQSVADLERRLWTQIAKRDIPKVSPAPCQPFSAADIQPLQVSRIAQQAIASRQFFNKRVSATVAREARRASVRTKSTKDIQVRAKKVMREVSRIWAEVHAISTLTSGIAGPGHAVHEG